MAQTKKNIIDSLSIILTRFAKSDDSRIDEDWLSYKIDEVRAELIIKQYQQTNVIDHTWLSSLLLTFHKVNTANNLIMACGCEISKSSIPQTITLQNKDGNLDLGIYSLISPFDKTTYYHRRMSMWGYCPPDHTLSLFGYYDRINTDLYVNKVVEKLKCFALLLNPEEGLLINSTPVTSGTVVNGTVYYVCGGQIIYNQVVYQSGTTFTGSAFGGVDVTTFVGSGTVYLNSELSAYRDVDPYPAGGEMIRAIELEILVKEFGIERQMLTDVRNDSKDDVNKQVQV